MMRYTVTAERGSGPVWVFQCVEHPGAISEGKRLSDAAELMPEIIAFVAEVPEDAIELDVRPMLPEDVLREVHAIKEAAASLMTQQVKVGDLSRRVAKRLVSAGLSGRDAAAVLGVSPQRVSQLVKESR